MNKIFHKPKSFLFYQAIMCLVIVILSFPTIAIAQRIIPLYPNNIPGALISPDEESGDIDAVKNVSRPTLTIFLPKEKMPGRAAVIICPGGGYGSLLMDREGYRIARLFADVGVVGFVLKYRLPDERIMRNQTTGPLQDAQQAIKMVRMLAAKNDIDPNKIGIMGFSAGGHLASTAGTHFQHSYIENKDSVSLRPDFMILVYPVISFMKGLVHEGSMHNVLGRHPSPKLIKEFSNELQVTSHTPTAFMVHAADDRWVPAGNSIKFYEALRKNNVPAELHIYAKGEHGFAQYPSLDEWMGRCKAWMRINNYIHD
ncbi:MAG: alpha/beta hydrolase [Ginsengibacter sp.]